LPETIANSNHPEHVPVMPDPVALSVVVPVKDEAGNAVPLAREIAAALKNDGAYEIIFVDDGSSDGTADELLALRGELPLRILVHERNLGQSRSLRTGIRAAKADLVVTLDGDGQNDPADIPKLIDAYRTAERTNPALAMIAGERLGRKDTWRKRAASRLANRVRRRLLGDASNDSGCGLKLFKREAFLSLPYFDHMHRYLIALMLREGYEVRFVPVGHRPRGAGRSKYGVWDRALVGVRDLMGVMWLKRRYRGHADIKEL
jgi:dolichol-phosphate mannosyltransferase